VSATDTSVLPSGKCVVGACGLNLATRVPLQKKYPWTMGMRAPNQFAGSIVCLRASSSSGIRRLNLDTTTTLTTTSFVYIFTPTP